MEQFKRTERVSLLVTVARPWTVASTGKSNCLDSVTQRNNLHHFLLPLRGETVAVLTGVDSLKARAPGPLCSSDGLR